MGSSDDFDDMMDFWEAFWIFVGVFLFMSFCGYCCTTKRRGTVISTPVVVTSTIPNLGTGYPIQTAGYQSNLYVPTHLPPNNVTVQIPMPMPTTMENTQAAGFQVPYMAPYPMPHPATADNMNPPSYDAAVRSEGGTQSNYTNEKQLAYNPNFVQ